MGSIGHDRVQLLRAIQECSVIFSTLHTIVLAPCTICKRCRSCVLWCSEHKHADCMGKHPKLQGAVPTFVNVCRLISASVSSLNST
mgnify:CR=1 FL=1